MMVENVRHYTHSNCFCSITVGFAKRYVQLKASIVVSCKINFGLLLMKTVFIQICLFLSGEQITSIEKTLIGFRYWLDESGDIHACYFTENHQVLYHSAEYLVGSLFPHELFPSNQKSGEWHRQHGLSMLEQWMNWKINFGFSEWCTNYYAEDMLALLGVYRYADNTKIKEKRKKLFVFFSSKWL